MTGRAIGALAIGLLIGVQVVRDAFVRAKAETDPASAQQIWRDHPDVRLSAGMVDIANAAREGRAASKDAFAKIYEAAISDSLAPEPFLVRGVQAQLTGDVELAKRAFRGARWRDGRSLPARYFLAEQYLQERDASGGLREVVALSRLVPGGVTKLAPFIARYAAEPANQGQLRQLFRSKPDLEESSLLVLAQDPKNAELILKLANPDRVGGKSVWLPVLLNALIEDRQFAEARNIWARVSGVSFHPGDLIYDPLFRREGAPPPFNWLLGSSAVGLSERQRGGGLHVIYYGSDSGTLASQILVLAPGRYQLTTRGTANGQIESLSWALICASTNQPIASVPLDRAVGAVWAFDVPQGCPAQRLELASRPAEMQSQSDFTIEGLALRREQSNG